MVTMTRTLTATAKQGDKQAAMGPPSPKAGGRRSRLALPGDIDLDLDLQEPTCTGPVEWDIMCEGSFYLIYDAIYCNYLHCIEHIVS